MNFAQILTMLFMMGASALAGPITLKVDPIGDKDTAVHGKSSKTQIPERVMTDARQLEIKLGNSTGQDFPNLTVKYYVFAKDIKAKEILLAKRRDKTISLRPLGNESFVTESTVMTLHSSSAKSKGGKMETKPASGYKFAGYGVQVLSGNEVLAELFEPKELKASTGLSETSTLYNENKWKKKAD